MSTLISIQVDPDLLGESDDVAGAWAEFEAVVADRFEGAAPPVEVRKLAEDETSKPEEA